MATGGGTRANSIPGTGGCTHILIPAGPTDFTPIRPPAHHEEEISPADGLLERLAKLMCGREATAEREMEAG